MPNKSPARREAATPESEAFALVQCLDYLETVARQSGFSLAAHMINLAKGAAMEAAPAAETPVPARAALRRQPATRRMSPRRSRKAAVRGTLS